MIKQAKQFHSLHASWLGDGLRPVPPEQSQARTNVCLKCPKNVKRPIYEFLAGIAVKKVKRTIEYKNRLGLRVDGEKDLHVCDACLCILELKVHAPLKHILATAPTDGLPKWCWIITETDDANKS